MKIFVISEMEGEIKLGYMVEIIVVDGLGGLSEGTFALKPQRSGVSKN